MFFFQGSLESHVHSLLPPHPSIAHLEEAIHVGERSFLAFRLFRTDLGEAIRREGPVRHTLKEEDLPAR